MKILLGSWGAVPYAILQDERLTPNALKVYCVLSGHQGGNDTCWPSRNRIAECAGIKDVKNMLKALRLLEETGWIVRSQRFNETNIYRVTMEAEDTPGVDSTPSPGVDSTPSPGVDSTPSPGVDSTPLKHHGKDQRKEHEKNIHPSTKEVYDLVKDLTLKAPSYWSLNSLLRKALGESEGSGLIALLKKFSFVAGAQAVRITNTDLMQFIYHYGEIELEEYSVLMDFVISKGWSWWIPKSFFENLTIIRERFQKAHQGSPASTTSSQMSEIERYEERKKKSAAERAKREQEAKNG